MQRTVRLGILLSPNEKTSLALLAEHEGGLSKAALIRRLLRKEARMKGYWPVASSTEPVTIDTRRKET